ncbi:HD domain-containing protein [Candidatus Micrarchaeota archaeon]|nr:HD domain-containing protein [Candidatus Micrarchaeota archaeon]MBU1930542.1 HD domain-containing protein [Candidatus Micrarchaeota archaeon]
MSKQLLSFFQALEKLKKIKRTGWIERGVKGPESIADHSFRMTILALTLAEKMNCNQQKLVDLCLVHDLHESICGDLILDFSRFGGTFKGLPPEEKKQKELDAKNKLFSMLDEKTRIRFEVLWVEFEEGVSKEAKIAKQLDKLEMLFQASEYHSQKNFEKEIFPVFLQCNRAYITEPVLKELLEELIQKTP